MAGLTDTRTELATDLEAIGVKVFDHVPNKLTPPCVLISTGDPYVTAGDVFNQTEFKVTLELFLIAATATNAVATKKLDSMIATVINHTADWTFEGASAPFMGEVNDAKYLTSRLTVSRMFDLTEEGA